MTDRDQIIAWAREAGVYSGANEFVFLPSIERFASLVAAHERERALKACKAEMIDEPQCNDDVAYNAGCHDCAAAVRGRAEK